MLNILNRHYIIFGVLIYLAFLPAVSTEVLPILLINFLFLIAYARVIRHFTSLNEVSLQKQGLRNVVYLYSFLSVATLNVLSYYFQGNYFVFSEGDALLYHAESMRMSSMSILSSIKYCLNEYSYDDLGAFLFISTIYRFIDSNLMLNLVYVFVGVVTAVAIYSISMNFMDRRYAFLASLTYSLSSYVQWFHSSGLKESIMVALVVLFYYFYYSFLREKSMWRIGFMIGLSLLLIIFRSPLMYFCIISIGVSIFLIRQQGPRGLLILVLIIAVIVYFSPIFEADYDRFLYSGDIDRVIQVKEDLGMIKGGFIFTFVVNVVSQAIGPLPSISPDNSKHLSIFSVGLIYRVLLAVPFWFGVYYAYKLKEKQLYPLILFVLFEMFSLISLLEGLELRKSLPHLANVYIIAFWFMNKVDKTDNKKIKNLYTKIFAFLFLILFGLIIYWNNR